MSTIIEEASDTPTSLGRLVFLVAVPAIALTVMAALALRPDTPRSEPVSVAKASVTISVTPASLNPRDDEHFTLYIMSSAHDAQRLTDLGARGPLLDWYAYVNTPEEEAELMKAFEHADWIRYQSGLPLSRVVDLRHTPVASTSAHGEQHREEQ